MLLLESEVGGNFSVKGNLTNGCFHCYNAITPGINHYSTNLQKPKMSTEEIFTDENFFLFTVKHV